MANSIVFGDILEAADQLPPEDQEALIAILRRRLVQAGRGRLAADVREARQEFAEGRCRPVTPDELMGEILS